MSLAVTGTKLSLQTPSDYNLARDVCSYGYFLLAPNHWDVSTQTLTTTLHLQGGPASCRLSQNASRSGAEAAPVRARFDRSLTRVEQTQARQALSRMLRLDESAEQIAVFHTVDPRWKASGRGRLFRSATLFEDVVKTVTSCNVAWPSTVNMNRRLCEVCGHKSAAGHFAFPTPARLARTRPATLRARCRVGYRDVRLVELAKLFAKGKINEPWLESADTPDDQVFAFLLTLPGVGPYAAGNIMQLLGRYSRLALDSESVRHGKTVLNMSGEERGIMKRMDAHYAQFGEHRFRSYWFEIWQWYESKRGPSHLWDREKVGSSFTAAQF